MCVKPKETEFYILTITVHNRGCQCKTKKKERDRRGRKRKEGRKGKKYLLKAEKGIRRTLGMWLPQAKKLGESAGPTLFRSQHTGDSADTLLPLGKDALYEVGVLSKTPLEPRYYSMFFTLMLKGPALSLWLYLRWLPKVSHTDGNISIKFVSSNSMNRNSILGLGSNAPGTFLH